VSPAGSNPSTSSTRWRTCSCYAAFRGTSDPTTAPSSWPKPCRTGSQPSAQARPTSHAAARGRTASSRASMHACVTSFSMGDLLLAPRGADRHRMLATPLQCRSAACLHRRSGSRPGGVRARTRHMAGCASPTNSAGHAPTGATTNPKLPSQPDHPTGADQGASHLPEVEGTWQGVSAWLLRVYLTAAGPNTGRQSWPRTKFRVSAYRVGDC
jgi:hypothetical protein